ncbi:MAG: EAL domain-containing protein [Pelosinus sp.]|nr:EAL domain-containing protein [Pelosinus sp.]
MFDTTHFIKGIVANGQIMKFAELSEKIVQQRHFAAIRRGLLLIIPFIVIGSFANLFMNLPLPAYQYGMSHLFGVHWKVIGSSINNATFGIMSMLLGLSISYFLAKSSRFGKNGSIHPQMAAFVSLACLIAIMQPLSSQGAQGLPFIRLGVFGLLPAMVTAIAASELFLWLSSVKRIHIGIFSDEADPVIAQAVAGILPAGVTLLLFSLLKFLAINQNVLDIYQLGYDYIKAPFLELPNTLGTAVLYHAAAQMLWFFGIHGQIALEVIQKGIYAAAGSSNLLLYFAGQQPTQILTSTFMDTYTAIGGNGSTICLIIATLLVARSGNTAWLAKLSILPGIFNINEIILFGLPIVLHPIYLIPFLLTPIIQTILSYIALAVGLVPLTNNVFHWTTPIFVNGYLAAHSWAGVILQLGDIVVGVMIYLPFVWLANQQKVDNMNKALVTLSQLAVSNSITKDILTQGDRVGNLFRVLAHDLKEAINKQELIIEYQPQVNQEKRVTGVEALLRWPHKVYGRISPPLIIAVAETTGLIYDLEKWIINTACRQQRIWQASNVDVIMAVNVSATQFYHSSILEDITKAIAAHGIDPRKFEIEITEGIAMNTDSKTKQLLDSLHEMGVRIAIDDFGTGYSSLNYIKNFPIDTLKIDKCLSEDITKDISSREIVSSIITLCASLHIKTIVEYIETEAQCCVLEQFGKVHYQGYLFSPSLTPAKAFLYIRKMNS